MPDKNGGQGERKTKLGKEEKEAASQANKEQECNRKSHCHVSFSLLHAPPPHSSLHLWVQIDLPVPAARERALSLPCSVIREEPSALLALPVSLYRDSYTFLSQCSLYL